MTKFERELTSRMWNTGDYLVSGAGGGYWWANENHRGCLIEAASSEEVACIQKLSREHRGGIVNETKTHRFESNND